MGKGGEKIGSPPSRAGRLDMLGGFAQAPFGTFRFQKAKPKPAENDAQAMAPTTRKGNQAGRMLNEFLVSLGLLFLLLVPDLAILNSAVTSSSRASSEDVALDLARNSMENSIAEVGSVRSPRNYEIDGTIYSQTVRLAPLGGERAGLILVVVDVDWNQGERGHRIRLERYVGGN